jgi:small nuclear ribonucleoprotein (snRNP)-like protein
MFYYLEEPKKFPGVIVGYDADMFLVLLNLNATLQL